MGPVRLTLGSVHSEFLQVSGDDTKKLPAGDYFLQFLGSGGEAGRIDVEVLPNYSLEDEPEPNSSRWKTVLDAVDAAIGGRATQAQLRVSVGDKSIEYCSLSELLSLRQFVKARLKEETRWRKSR